VLAPVSLVATAFAPVLDAAKTRTPMLVADRGPTTLVLVDLGRGRDRIAGSVFCQVYGASGDGPADLDDPQRLVDFFEAMQELYERDLVLAYHDRSDGGLLVTLCEMAFASRCGLLIDLPGEDAVRSAFAEELGAVLQVRDVDLPVVLEVFEGHGLGPCASPVGRPADHVLVEVRHRGRQLFKAPRTVLQRTWSELSWRMATLRDDPESAREEYDRIVDERDLPLAASLTFDPGHDPVRPTLVGRPPIAILREQGVNGQLEMAAAFERAGFAPIDVHMTDLASGRVDLADFVGLVAVGGFSYGDVLGAGGGWAKSVLFDGRLRDGFARFFGRRDTFSLGVCNGCQMFSQLADLVPGAEDWPRFVRNRSEQFEGRLTSVRVEESKSVLLSGMAGSVLLVPVAHGEGRALFGSDAQQQRIEPKVALRYVDGTKVAETYPRNPSGTPAGIAGLTSADGRVTVMMPHPERVFRWSTLSWCPDDWKIPTGDSPWMRMFRNARVWCG
jgi:phosphoribosylformylglycinamidine synthase